MMFEFGEYCFIKWKFKFWNFLSEIWNLVCSIDWNFCLIDRSGEGNYLRVFACFDWYSIPIQSIEKSFRSILDSSQSIKTCENWISAKFSDNCSEHLQRFQALWTILWNILTLHIYLLKGYNSIGINRSLYSLEKKKTISPK